MKIPGMSISIPWEYAIPMLLLAILAVPAQILLCRLFTKKHWKFILLYLSGLVFVILLLTAIAAWTGLDDNPVIYTLLSPFSSYGMILWGFGLIVALLGIGLGFLIDRIMTTKRTVLGKWPSVPKNILT